MTWRSTACGTTNPDSWLHLATEDAVVEIDYSITCHKITVESTVEQTNICQILQNLHISRLFRSQQRKKSVVFKKYFMYNADKECHIIILKMYLYICMYLHKRRGDISQNKMFTPNITNGIAHGL